MLVAAGISTSSAQHAPAWVHGATCYEIFVRSFYDSDGDGVGDLRGLTAKLDYINDGNPRSTSDLGARCIWLMPIMESPSYHGYDATNYYKVEPDYGTNDDFKRFVAEAHKRGIKVLIDMVLNHMSNEHPYFQAALRDTASPYRSWFVFSPTDQGKGIWGNQVWHKSPVRDEYYYGIFWHGMPDLNYKTGAVREEAKKVARFWLQDMGVDGFRLDAIPFLVEENGVFAGAPGTHDVLREYSAYVRRIAPGAWTVGEVWDSTGTMLTYYPDQLDAHFAFELSDAIVNSLRSGNGATILDKYLRLQRALPAYRYAPFLRNHDQTRTMTDLKGDVAKAKVSATLLLTLPGLPFVYYGEEIGMTGDKPDERLRTPMHWRPRAPSAGFTSAKPWEPLQPDSLTANVDVERGDPASLFNLYRKLIHLRADNPALAEGELVPLTSGSEAVVAYVRRTATRGVLVVANVGEEPLTRIALSGAPGTLPRGSYSAPALIGTQPARILNVAADGSITTYVPLATIPAKRAYVFDLVSEH